MFANFAEAVAEGRGKAQAEYLRRTKTETSAKRLSGDRVQEVSATELNPTERIGYFRDVLGPLARSIPFGVQFMRIVDGVDINDPVAAAEGRRVFELHPVP